MDEELRKDAGWGLGRRAFLGAVSVGAASWMAGCSGAGDLPTPKSSRELVDPGLFKVPPGVLKNLAEERVPPEQQRMTVEEFTKPARDKYDPPIEISTVTGTQPAVKYSPGDSIEKNPWSRAYERKYGIKVTVKWAVDSTQLEQRTNLMIASGDLPDYFLASQSQMKQLIEGDLIEDLTETYRTHATDKTRAVILEGGSTPLQSAIYDGRIMGIPMVAGFPETSPIWFIRKDWLDKLGLAEPKTMTDLLRTAEAFTSQDPNRTGKKDTYGIAADQTLDSLAGFFNGYHAYRRIWIEKDGELVYGSIQPEVKQALFQLQRMYKARQIDPEFGAKSITKVYEDVVAGRIGIIQGRGSASFGADQLKQNDASANVIALPIVSVDSQPAMPQVDQPSCNGYYVVRKGYKHPEAVLKMIDFGLETGYWTPSDEILRVFQNDQDTDSNTWLLNRAPIYRTFKNIDVHRTVTKLIDSKSPDLASLRPEARLVYNEVKFAMRGDPAYYSWITGFYGPKCGRAAEDVYRRNNRYMMEQFYGQPTKTMGQRLSGLDKREDETFTNIIKGTDISEFDTFVKDWNRIGGEQITKEVNEWRATQ